MGWFGFGGKDWNVVAIIYERADIYRVNGNRGRGRAATGSRNGARTHDRTIYWAVFDQHRKRLDGGPGPGARLVPADVVKQLERELAGIPTVVEVLESLEDGSHEKAARTLEWRGYPPAG